MAGVHHSSFRLHIVRHMFAFNFANTDCWFAALPGIVPNALGIAVELLKSVD